MPNTKKNQPDQYTPDTQVYEKRVIEIGFWKATSILAGAILVSIVGTAFTLGSILNSDHFLLANTVDQLNSLEENTVRRDVYEVQQAQIIKELGEIKTLLNR